MAFVLQVPEIEELIDAVPKPQPRSGPFCFAVTKEAVYLPTRKRGFVLGEPFETTRLPLSSIRRVVLYPARVARGNIVLYSFVAFVLAVSILIDFSKDRENLAITSLYITVLCVSLFIGIIQVILGPRGRYCLQIDIWQRPLDFVPHLESIISAKTKAEEQEVQIRFLDACQRAGLSVYRPSPNPDCLQTAGHP